MNIDEFEALEDKGQSLEDLFNTGSQEPQEPENPVDIQDNPAEPANEPTPEGEEPPAEPSGEQPPAEPQQPQEPEKKVQTPEENAFYAEQRRQKQIQQAIEQERQKWMQESPEVRLAQMLAQQYGTTPEQLIQQVQEAQLRKEAQERNVPYEFLKERQQWQQQQAQLQQRMQEMEAQQWASRIQLEHTQLKTKYPMLTDEEIQKAAFEMLPTGMLKNPQMPLETAVHALYGQKILQSQREALRNELLAEISGRKSNPLPPQGSVRQPETPTLTEEEKAVARAMGISEEDYLKYKY